MKWNPHWRALQKIIALKSSLLSHWSLFAIVIQECWSLIIQLEIFSVTHILWSINLQRYSGFSVWFSVSYSRSELSKASVLFIRESPWPGLPTSPILLSRKCGLQIRWNFHLFSSTKAQQNRIPTDKKCIYSKSHMNKVQFSSHDLYKSTWLIEPVSKWLPVKFEMNGQDETNVCFYST